MLIRFFQLISKYLSELFQFGRNNRPAIRLGAILIIISLVIIFSLVKDLVRYNFRDNWIFPDASLIQLCLHFFSQCFLLLVMVENG